MGASGGDLGGHSVGDVQLPQRIAQCIRRARGVAGGERADRGLRNAAVVSQELLSPLAIPQVIEQLRPVHREPLKHRSFDIVPNGFPIVNIATLIPMARHRSEFGSRMLEAREAVGLTQQAVRDALGVAQSTLSHLETAAKGSARTIEFARLYEVRPEWLASGVGVMKAEEPAPDPRAALVVADMLQNAPREDRDIWFATILRDIHRNPGAYSPEDRARFEAAVLALNQSGALN